MRRPTFVLLVLALSLLLLAACTGGRTEPPVTVSPVQSGSTTGDVASTALPTVATPKINFADCTTKVRSLISNPAVNKFSFQCGPVLVPVDYTNPTGTKIQLYLVKVHLIAQKPSDRIGSLLVNPGGPGASGVQLALSLTTQLKLDVFQHFDVVGFDPRGVGLSSSVTCISDAQKDANAALDPDVRTVAGQTQARTSAIAIVKECTKQYPETLAHINTEETARDMDVLRAALGDQKLNYLGFSYGTRLGSIYAHEFPTKIRVAALDGAVDPSTNELGTDEQQVKGFEDAFDQFAADCRNRSACTPIGDPRTAVEKLITSADATPIPSSAKGETRLATGGNVTTAVVSALYSQSDWPALGDAIIAAQHGDSAQVFALADNYNERDATGKYTNIADANLAITCNDSNLKLTDAQIQTTATQWIAKYPIFGKSSAASLYACFGWPPSRHSLPPANAPGAPPVLIVGTVHDPATPFQATSALASAIGSGVVLSWDGEGHTAYLSSPCIETKVNSYLITATVPADDSCPKS